MGFDLIFVIWAVMIALTHFLFTYFSEKYNSLFKLLLLTLFPVWIISSIIQGIQDVYLNKEYFLEGAREISGLFLFTLPSLIVFGGITFTIKYIKFKKNGNKKI